MLVNLNLIDSIEVNLNLSTQKLLVVKMPIDRVLNPK